MAIIGNAYIVVHAITSNFQQEVGKDLVRYNKDFAQAGRNAGQSFSKGLQKGSDGLSAFQREALAANEAFTKMVVTGYALGPAISVAIGGISSLVSGLFALGAQVASATPALFVLVGAFAALGQAALAAKLAFGGIGAAFKQLTKGGGGAVKSAKQVENAERNLARVLEQNREALTRANERLADAEERLTEARKEAAEWLQQLNFDAEDAALAEKRAVLALEDARLSLMRVQDLPPNSRARTEAELAYAEADLNLRRAIDRNQDLASETDEANAKGVEGSRQVVDATKAVQEAIDDRARTERDALRSLIDAQNALNDARNSGGGGAGQDALKNLSEEARKFVEYLVSIKDKTQGLKAAAGKFLFPQLEKALDNIVNKLFPSFEPILEATGKALGKSALDFSKVVTEANNLEKFERVGKNNTYVIENLGKVVGNLYDSFLSLMDAADPLIRRFTDWVVTLTDGWRESLNTKNATGELTDMFNKAGDAAAQIGDILKNIWDGLMNLGRAAAGPGSGGQQLMDTFQGATERFVQFTDAILKDGSAEQFFRDVADNFTAISGLLSDIVGGFIAVGNEKGIGDTATKLRDAGPSIREMIETLIEGAPAFAEAATGVADLVRAFTESESINAFFGTLKEALDILNAIFGSGIAQGILGFIAPILGVYKAFWLMNKVGGFAGKVLFGYGLKAGEAAEKSKGLFGVLKTGAGKLKAFGGAFKVAKANGDGFFKAFGKASGIAPKISGSVGGIGKAFSMMASPIGLAVLAVAAVIAILVIAYKKSETFREAVKKLIDLVWGRLKEAFETIKKTLDEVLGKFGGTEKIVGKLNDAFKEIGDFIGKYIVPIVGKLLVIAIDQIVGKIQFLIYTIGAIAKVFQAVWEVIQGIFALMRGDMDGVKEHFGKAIDAIGAAFGFLKDAIIGAFRGAFNLVADIWNNTIGQIGFTLPDWLGGASWEMPKIKKWTGGGDDSAGSTSTSAPAIRQMASGAIVNRPTMALIGEAGREAVIPLTRPLRALQLMNSSGLSDLARAGVPAKSAGPSAQPFNINVYPSQGMDEVELASLVGRQVTLQLRKGTL